MFKFIKITFFLFLLLTTATAFGKSTKYFENTLVHMFGSDCNSKCRQEIIKSETDYAVVLILKLISTELHQKLLVLERGRVFNEDLLVFLLPTSFA